MQINNNITHVRIKYCSSDATFSTITTKVQVYTDLTCHLCVENKFVMPGNKAVGFSKTARGNEVKRTDVVR